MIEDQIKLKNANDVDYYENLQGYSFINTDKKYKRERVFLNEYNDCTVKALACALDITYDQAHSKLKTFGRKNNKGCFMNEYLDAASFVQERLVFKGMSRRGFNYKKQSGCSVGRFAEENKLGTFILLVRGHALTIKEGVIYDYCAKPKRHIRLAYKIIQ